MFSSENNDLSVTNPLYNVTLKASDRFLKSCPIKYDCRKLFVCLVELDYSKELNDTEIILQYPETIEKNNLNDKNELSFIKNVKNFAFPFKNAGSEFNNQKQNSSLVKFYTFVFTDSNRIRLYGFCRSSQNGNRVLCIVSHLPWHNVYINLLNKIANIINDKEASVLNNFLEALYEYELPEPGQIATIISHDGLEQIQFTCPDRRTIPSINENRNLLKFFAFFDLNKLIKIFTALLLERKILIVSKDIENITSCALSLEYLIYPLEWLHAFAPILPDTIDLYLFHQPFPYIYGINTSIYQKLNSSHLNESVILLVDEREILNCDNDHLPKNVANDIRKKLKFFQNPQTTDISRNMGKYDLLLKTGPIRAFQEAVLTIIGDYNEYICFDENSKKFKIIDELFFDQHDASNSTKNKFYNEFYKTQAFIEFKYDRIDYLNDAKLCKNPKYFSKDYVEYLFEQFYTDNNSFQNLIKSAGKKFDQFRKQTSLMVDNLTEKVEKAKEKQVVKKLFMGHVNNNNDTQNDISAISSIDFDEELNNKKKFEISEPIRVTKPMIIRPNKPVLIHRTKAARLAEKTSNTDIKSINNNDDTNQLESNINNLKIQEQTQINNNNNNNNNNLISYSRSLSNSSTTSSNSSISLSINKIKQTTVKQKTQNNDYNNKFSYIDLNLSTDPEICKYLVNNNNNNNNVENELVDLFTNNNENNNLNNNDNPFANDRFIDQFKPIVNDKSLIETFKNQLNENNNNNNINSFEISSLSPPFNLSATHLVSPSTATINNKNEILIANKLNNNQSIIDEFDPIKTNENSNNHYNKNTQNITTIKNFIEENQYQHQHQHQNPPTQINSFILPKPFQYQQQQQQQQQSQYSLNLLQQQQPQYFIQSEMSSLPYNQQSQQQQQQQQQQLTKPQLNTNNQVYNSYLSFAATPFYGFNQRPQQFGYHSVAYPVQSNKNDKTTTTSSNSNQTSSLFNNDNSLI